MRFRSLRLLVFALALSLPFGCGKTAPVNIPGAPATVQVDANVRAAAVKALNILDAVSILGEDAQTAYVRVQQTGIVPAAADANIRAHFRRFGEEGAKATRKIRDGAIADWVELKATVDPVIQAVESIVNLVRVTPEGQRREWGSLVFSLFNIVVSILQPGVPRLDFAGATS